MPSFEGDSSMTHTQMNDSEVGIEGTRLAGIVPNMSLSGVTSKADFYLNLLDRFSAFLYLSKWDVRLSYFWWRGTMLGGRVFKQCLQCNICLFSPWNMSIKRSYALKQNVLSTLIDVLIIGCVMVVDGVQGFGFSEQSLQCNMLPINHTYLWHCI